jgi:hypothetical protein
MKTKARAAAASALTVLALAGCGGGSHSAAYQRGYGAGAKAGRSLGYPVSHGQASQYCGQVQLGTNAPSGIKTGSDAAGQYYAGWYAGCEAAA